MTGLRSNRSDNRFSATEACVIVPVYNEAPVLGEVLDELTEHFALVVCIDDASSDGSGAIARSHGAVVVTHPVNLGQGAALQTGIAYALRRTLAETIVTFDADGQHDPRDAVRLVEKVVTREVDVALGSRFLSDHDQVPTARRLVLKAGVVFTRMSTRLDVTDTHNGLRALSRSAAERIDLRIRGMAHASELLRLVAVHHLSYAELPVTIRYTDHSRSKGQSNINAVNVLADVFLQGVFRRR